MGVVVYLSLCSVCVEAGVLEFSLFFLFSFVFVFIYFGDIWSRDSVLSIFGLQDKISSGG